MKYVNVSEKSPWDGGSGAMLGLGLSLPQSPGKGGGVETVGRGRSYQGTWGGTIWVAISLNSLLGLK